MAAQAPGNNIIQVLLDAHTQPYIGTQAIINWVQWIADDIRAELQNNPDRIDPYRPKARSWIWPLSVHTQREFVLGGWFTAHSHLFSYWMDERLFPGWVWHNLATSDLSGRGTRQTLHLSSAATLCFAPAIQRPTDPPRPAAFRVGAIYPDGSPPPPIPLPGAANNPGPPPPPPPPPQQPSAVVVLPVPGAATNVAAAPAPSNTNAAATNDQDDEDEDENEEDGEEEEEAEEQDEDESKGKKGDDEDDDDDDEGGAQHDDPSPSDEDDIPDPGPTDSMDTESPTEDSDAEPEGDTADENDGCTSQDAPESNNDNEEEIDLSKPGKTWTPKTIENLRNLPGSMAASNLASPTKPVPASRPEPSTNNTDRVPSDSETDKPALKKQKNLGKQKEASTEMTEFDESELSEGEKARMRAKLSMPDISDSELLPEDKAQLSWMEGFLEREKAEKARAEKPKEEKADVEKAKAGGKKKGKKEKKEKKLQEVIDSMVHGEKGMK